jgi:hypothetical protein
MKQCNNLEVSFICTSYGHTSFLLNSISAMYFFHFISFVLVFVLKCESIPSEVTHACNPRYLGGGDGGNCNLRTACAKSNQDSQLNKKLDVVAHTCNPSCMWSEEEDHGLGCLR